MYIAWYEILYQFYTANKMGVQIMPLHAVSVKFISMPMYVLLVQKPYYANQTSI